MNNKAESQINKNAGKLISEVYAQSESSVEDAISADTFDPNTDQDILQWDNISFTAKKRILRPEISTNHTISLLKVVSKSIIRDISGFVESGQLLAVMGPSGSGKVRNC